MMRLPHSSLPGRPPGGLARLGLNKLLLAAVAVAAAAGIRLLLDPILGSLAPFMLFELAVMVCALWGGLQAGIPAVVLGGVVCDYLFLEPRHSFAISGHSGVGWVVFSCVGLVVNLLAYRLAEAEKQTAAANGALRQANNELRDSEAMLELAQTAAGCGLWEVSLPTREVRWSRSFRQLYGLPDGMEASDRNWIAIVDPEDREKVRAALDRAFEEKGRLSVEFRAGEAGKRRWFAAMGRTFPDPEGRPVRLAGITLDITARKHMEDALERSNEDLQRFAYAIAHDLKEPLRTVGSYCQLLARRNRGKLDPDSDEFLGFILNGVERMHGLIQGLLDYSRISYRPDEKVWVSAAAVLERALQHLDVLVRESGAKVTCDTLPAVNADPDRLLQVFQNLISNAIKYRRAAPPEVHLSAKRRGEDWIFSVRDNGIGIDMRQADRIFGVFQRLHSHSEYEGAGVGLAIVKRIVERHGGRVWLESEPGKGSTFYFSIRAGEDVPAEMLAIAR